MIDYKVIEFCGVYVDFKVKLARRFRVLNEVPKCWREVVGCTTPHGIYESGCTTIYQSQTTKKYYMVRYFDGCFSQMYAEVSDINWDNLKEEFHRFWELKRPIKDELLHLWYYDEISQSEMNERNAKIRREAKKFIMKIVS